MGGKTLPIKEYIAFSLISFCAVLVVFFMHCKTMYAYEGKYHMTSSRRSYDQGVPILASSSEIRKLARKRTQRSMRSAPGAGQNSAPTSTGLPHLAPPSHTSTNTSSVSGRHAAKKTSTKDIGGKDKASRKNVQQNAGTSEHKEKLRSIAEKEAQKLHANTSATENSKQVDDKNNISVVVHEKPQDVSDQDSSVTADVTDAAVDEKDRNALDLDPVGSKKKNSFYSFFTFGANKNSAKDTGTKHSVDNESTDTSQSEDYTVSVPNTESEYIPKHQKVSEDFSQDPDIEHNDSVLEHNEVTTEDTAISDSHAVMEPTPYMDPSATIEDTTVESVSNPLSVSENVEPEPVIGGDVPAYQIEDNYDSGSEVIYLDENNSTHAEKYKAKTLTPTSAPPMADNKTDQEEGGNLLQSSTALSPEEALAKSQGKIQAPKRKKIKSHRKPVSVFRFFMSWVFAFLFCAATGLAAFGYKMYLDNAQNRVKDEAYSQGVRDSKNQPTIDSVVKLDQDSIRKMVYDSATSTLPVNTKFTDMIMDSWTIPGGNETYGRVDLSICYTGEGVEGTKVAKANLISDNANSNQPQWMVDALSLTQDNCWK